MNVLPFSFFVLLGFLGVSVFTDIRERKIPNSVVAIGTAFAAGVALQQGLSVLWGAFGGWAIGMGMLMPLYLLRGMSAGDVKLMGMVGAFLGWQGAVAAVLYAALAGGVMAIVLWLMCRYRPAAVSRGAGHIAAQQACSPDMKISGSASRDVPRRGIPYAVAIAMGTCIQLATCDPSFLSVV